jgi:hypothetical protein
MRAWIIGSKRIGECLGVFAEVGCNADLRFRACERGPGEAFPYNSLGVLTKEPGVSGRSLFIKSTTFVSRYRTFFCFKVSLTRSFSEKEVVPVLFSKACATVSYLLLVCGGTAFHTNFFCFCGDFIVLFLRLISDLDSGVPNWDIRGSRGLVIPLRRLVLFLVPYDSPILALIARLGG